MPNGVNKVLELIGTPTLKDSLKCIASKGIVCMTGILGGEWVLKDFQPMGDIPSLGRLTVYMGEADDLDESRLQEFIDAVEKGDITIVIDKSFTLDEIADAHAYMESNQSQGKLVVQL
jgi:NADPH:quinone reductase-like Zn-dependent oxidoreductase